MRQIFLIVLLLVLTTMLSATLLWNDAVPIRQGVNIEWFRTGTETSDGGAIYVWSDTKLGERDLWAQKVDASGNLVWGSPVLIDGKPDRQEDPVITRTSDGNYIIAWIDFSDDLDGNVYAQKINEQGQLMWQTGGKPVCLTNGIQIALNMEADSAGGAFILWVDSRNPSKDLYGQRISSSGEPLWALNGVPNGIPIANGEGDEVQNTMLPNGQGGMIVAYTHTYVGEANIYAKNFNADGVMTWGVPLGLATVLGNQSGVRMAALDNSEYIFTWTDLRASDSDIYAQKVNINGQVLWTDPYIVYSDQGAPIPAHQQNPRIQKTSDNCVVIVWEDFRLDNQNADLFAQKISANGTKLWASEGIPVATAEFAQIGQRLASDGNGGVYIVWDDLRNGNSPNEDIYAQHLSSSGTELWTAGGRPICTMPFEQNGGLVKVANGNVFINWMDLRNGSVGIYFQVLNPAGTMLLEENGRQVFWGLSGDTPKEQYQIINRAEDVVVIWQDTRFANEGYRIFFQFVAPDGSQALEVNGRPVTLQGGGKQETPHAVTTPNGDIAIVWVDGRNDDPSIYAQLISPQGERLWGDNGIKITESTPLSQKDPKISYVNGSFIIGWSNWDPVGANFIYHVYAQRIENNQMMWGPDGVMVSVLPSNQLNNECTLKELIDDTFVWHRVNPAANSQTIWLKRLGTDGNAFPGWDDEGLLASSYSGLPLVQLLPAAHKTDEGTVVIWKDIRGDFVFNYWGQHISSEGTRLWNPLGVNLADRGNEQELPAITKTPTGIVFAWCENRNGMHDIVAQKFSYPGEALWGSLGNFAVEKDSTQSHPNLVGFPGGGMLLTWTEYLAIESDIYYNYINANGTLVYTTTAGEVLSNAGKAQYEPKAVAKGSEAYVIWADGRSSGKTEILGLYAQKLNDQATSNNDLVSPSVNKLDLQQNYPNPFNPNTIISLNMPRADKLDVNVYNSKGQLVKKLFSGSVPQGKHSFNWDGTDNSGNTVSSGIYFYSASTTNSSQTRKMLLMK